jgi:hypothetical protein
MNESEIDEVYLDSKFSFQINGLDDEKFQLLLNYILENYSESFEAKKITDFTKVISSLFGSELDCLNLFRQFIYLINKAVYNRLSKKFKYDLSTLGFTEGKIERIVESIRPFLERINEIKENRESKNKKFYIRDFEIKTEMPVYNSEYNINKNSICFNEDANKQNIFVKFNYDIDEHEENFL